MKTDYEAELRKQEKEIERIFKEFDRQLKIFTDKSQSGFALRMLASDPNIEKKIGKRRTAKLPYVLRLVEEGQLGAAEGLIDAYAQLSKPAKRIETIRKRMRRARKEGK